MSGTVDLGGSTLSTPEQAPGTGTDAALARRQLRRLLTGLLLLAVLAASAGLGVRSISHGLEHTTLNWRYSVRPDRPASSKVVLVAIDSETGAALNERLPPSRDLQARVVRRLSAAGAKVIAYDLALNGVSDDPDADVDIVKALSAAPRAVVSVTRYDTQTGAPDLLAGITRFADTPVRPGLTLRLGQRSGTWIGFTPAVGSLDSFPVAAATAFTGAPVRLPARALVDYRGPSGTVPTLSFADVLRGNFDPKAIRGKVVVVGSTAPELGDLHDVPGGRMSGPELQANAIATAADGFPLTLAARRTDTILILCLALLEPLLLAAIAFTLRRRTSPPPSAIAAGLSLALVVVWVVLAQVIFAHGLAIAFVPTTLAVVIAAGGGWTLYRRYTLARRRALRRRISQGDESLGVQLLTVTTGRGELGRLKEFVPGYALDGAAKMGSMGVVYPAQQISLERRVAIKVINDDFRSDPAYRARFLAEGKAAAKVEHAHLVPIHDSGEHDGSLFIVMRWIDGPTLDDTIRHGALSLLEAATLLDRVASALDALAQEGLAHCDVKPSNILRTTTDLDHPYLTDFGVATFPDETSKRGGGGTPLYMAPEQWRSAADLGRADIYALGAVLFQCVTGVVPFTAAEGNKRLAYLHANAERPRASERRVGLPPELDPLITKAMAIEPAERYATAQAFTEMVLEVARDWTNDQPSENEGGSKLPPAPTQPL